MKTVCSFALLTDERRADARSGQVLDLSERGLFVASNSLYPPGTALALSLEIPGQRLPVRLSGEVAWARTADPAGMYVRLAPAAGETVTPSPQVPAAVHSEHLTPNSKLL